MYFLDLATELLKTIVVLEIAAIPFFQSRDL